MVFCLCLRYFCMNPPCFVLAVSFCVVGVMVTVGGGYWYYTKFYPTVPTASLEHTGMYDYVHDYDSVVKRTKNDGDGSNNEEYDYYSDNKKEEVEAYDTFRDKRNLTIASSTVNGGKQTTHGEIATTIGSPNAKGKAKGQQTTPSTTTVLVDDEPGFEASNIFVDSVFNSSDKEKLSDSLGLCRRGKEVKMPVQFKASYFPPEDATGILNCINDILQNETKKQVCVQLDEELNAYLRWLTLTGEPKEKQRAPSLVVKDDFLFPANACAAPGNAESSSESPEQVDSVKQKPKCLVQEQGQESDNNI